MVAVRLCGWCMIIIGITTTILIIIIMSYHCARWEVQTQKNGKHNNKTHLKTFQKENTKIITITLIQGT